MGQHVVIRTGGQLGHLLEISPQPFVEGLIGEIARVEHRAPVHPVERGQHKVKGSPQKLRRFLLVDVPLADLDPGSDRQQVAVGNHAAPDLGQVVVRPKVVAALVERLEIGVVGEADLLQAAQAGHVAGRHHRRLAIAAKGGMNVVIGDPPKYVVHGAPLTSSI